jgi:opacity protein-like surface antigen
VNNVLIIRENNVPVKRSDIRADQDDAAGDQQSRIMKEMIMRTLAALALVFLVGGGTEVSAKSGGVSDKRMFEVDGSFGFGSGSGALDSGYGCNFGAGYMLSSIDKNLQARVDLSYYDFSTTFLGQDLSYTRVPITVSARYYFPINNRLKAFAQAGIETSYDSFESYAGTVNKHTENEVNFGISPGGGIEFSVLPEVSIFALGRIHIITDNYFSMQFGAAFHV